MENKLDFGSFDVPYLDNRESTWVTYNAPSILSMDLLKKTSFNFEDIEIASQKNIISDNYNSKVTHKVFFGENIKRIISAFK